MTHPTLDVEPFPLDVAGELLLALALNFDPRRFDGEVAGAAAALWSQQLAGVDPEIARQVANDMLADPDRIGLKGFPDVGEFAATCVTYTRHAVAQQIRRETGESVCMRCGGDGMIWGKRTQVLRSLVQPAGRQEDGSAHPMATETCQTDVVQPCPLCSSPDAAYVAEGHLHPRHDVNGCAHERCQARAEHYKRTRHR